MVGIMEVTGVLHQRLIDAGIPVVGVADLGGGAYRVDYAPEATQQQIAEAEAIVAAFDAEAEQAILDAKEAAAEQANEDFKQLPNWGISWTGQEAADALKTAILSGMTKAEARAAIDAQMATVTNLATAVAVMSTLLKQLSDAVIDGRDTGHQNEARAIMYLRDIVIK